MGFVEGFFKGVKKDEVKKAEPTEGHTQRTQNKKTWSLVDLTPQWRDGEWWMRFEVTDAPIKQNQKQR